MKKFVGTWKLISCTETDPKGKTFYPWGQDAIGYLIYTAEGIMAVQIMRKNRNPFSGNDITQATPQEGQQLAKDYNAYFGPFKVDETNKTVIHTVQGHLNPNMIGKNNIRVYKFYDDKLSLTTQGSNIKEIIWQKVSI